jgi:hypothetical protein
MFGIAWTSTLIEEVTTVNEDINVEEEIFEREFYI